MHCPFCSAPETRVIDSRLANDGDKVRRRRECISCNERFTTYEGAELNMPRIVKTTGSRVPYVEEKLRSGIMRSLEKRPVDTEQMEAAISRIQHKLLAVGEREISSRKLGDWVMDELLALDDVAYIRFASVYLDFSDVSAFRDAVERLERKSSKKSSVNKKNS